MNERNAQVEKKIPGGKYIKIYIQASTDKIDDVNITGDFFIYPESLIDSLEEQLQGRPVNENEIKELMIEHIKNFDEPVEFIGIDYDDIIRLTLDCILKVRK